jgi:hypothetical protein
MEIKPILSFDFDIVFYEDEIRMKGYCGNVIVTLPDYLRYRVCFYDPVRLQQDLTDETYIAEPGLIVINELTKNNMEKAVCEIWLEGYFDQFKPVS